ncbi:large conductance mechanosensitive channel protein MscL [Clostridium bovifaecis]|uniref:Large-conductance mechanosensitive channel n=1 Tax=Clostridium bovifaecis TaxID=2184719 RepID=A0A6I6EL83_9CLOT|nr:large conductance mechanosensitive channel protein MscL [Clostridium bovifaecis]
MWSEFKKFAIKGNVVDLAVGVIIGGAFGKIVTSLVNDIIMPLVGLLLGKISFRDLFITLGEGAFTTLDAAQKAGVPTLNYGLFLNNILDFLIITFSIFIVIRQMNRLSKKKEEPAPKPLNTQVCKYCYSEININATRCPHCTSELN